jgi:membrane protein
MPKFERLKAWIWRAIENSGPHNLARLAGAFSFFAALSISPTLVLIVFFTARSFGSEDAVRPFIDQIRSAVGNSSADYVEELIASSRQPEYGLLAAVLSFAITFFSASNLFVALQDAVNTIFGFQLKGHIVENWLRMRARAFMGVAVYGGTAILWLVADAALSHVSGQVGGTVARAGSAIVLISVLMVLVGIWFRTLAPISVRWREVWPAAIITAIGIWACRNLVGIYFELIPITRVYGSAGALVVLLLWIFYTAQIFFFGLELFRAYREIYVLDPLKLANNPEPEA